MQLSFTFPRRIQQEMQTKKTKTNSDPTPETAIANDDVHYHRLHLIWSTRTGTHLLIQQPRTSFPPLRRHRHRFQISQKTQNNYNPSTQTLDIMHIMQRRRTYEPSRLQERSHHVLTAPGAKCNSVTSTTSRITAASCRALLNLRQEARTCSKWRGGEHGESDGDGGRESVSVTRRLSRRKRGDADRRMLRGPGGWR